MIEIFKMVLIVVIILDKVITFETVGQPRRPDNWISYWINVLVSMYFIYLIWTS